MHQDVARAARERAGVVVLAGLPRQERDAVVRLVRAGSLRRTGRRTAVSVTSPASFPQRLWIARAELGEPMAFRGATAAAILRFPGVAEPRRIEAFVPCSRRIASVPGTSVTYARPGDLVGMRVVEGQPVTSVEVTVRELARSVPVGRLVTVVQDQLRLRTTTESRLRSVMGRGRAGSARLREALDVAGDGAQSRAERALHQALRQAGATGFRRQVALSTSDGAAYWLDLLFDAAGIGVEVMGPHHLDPEEFEYDCRRANRILGEHGVRLLRYTAGAVARDPAGVVAEILDLTATAARPRGARSPARRSASARSGSASRGRRAGGPSAPR